MNRRLWVGALAALLIPLPAMAKPVASRQTSMTRNGVSAVFTKESGKPTIYGVTLPLTFQAAEKGKMLEIVAESPVPVKIELWTGTIPANAKSWDRNRTFLGSSGNESSKRPSFKWMVEPGPYTALILATLPAGEKPEPFLVSYGKEVRTASEADKAEWEKAVSEYTLSKIQALHARRTPAAPFTAITYDRKTISLSQLRQKVVLVYFWSQQGPGFAETFGLISALAAKHGPEGLEAIGISLDSDPAAFEQFIQGAQPTWPQAFDQATGNEALAEKYGVDGWSGTFLIDGTRCV